MLSAAGRLPALEVELTRFLAKLIDDEIVHWCIERMERGGSEGHLDIFDVRFGEVQPRPGDRFRIRFECSTAAETALAYDEEHRPPPPTRSEGWIEVDGALAVRGLAIGGLVIRG